MTKLEKAIRLAREAHRGQKRKDFVTPYIEHPLAVMRILRKVTKDEEVLCAGVLHDTLEDTEVTYKTLKKEFGKRVADTVKDVTNDPDEHEAPLETREGIIVKLADMLHNMSDNENKDYWEEKVKVMRENMGEIDDTRIKKESCYNLEPSDSPVWKNKPEATSGGG